MNTDFILLVTNKISTYAIILIRENLFNLCHLCAFLFSRDKTKRVKQ